MLHMKWSVWHAGTVVWVLGSLGMVNRMLRTVVIATTTTRIDRSREKANYTWYVYMYV